VFKNSHTLTGSAEGLLLGLRDEMRRGFDSNREGKGERNGRGKMEHMPEVK